MNELETKTVWCPYCGEAIDVLIDCSLTNQHYIEDCQVCCRPINFDVSLQQNGEVSVQVAHENE